MSLYYVLGVMPALTPREREVLLCIAGGDQDPDIAHRLHISKQTVRTHVERILLKLGARTRTQALALALQQDLISVADLPEPPPD